MSGDRSCIMLVAEHGFAARYLLRTDIFACLTGSGHKVVILSPSANEESFREEFIGHNVALELYDSEAVEEYYRRSKPQHLLRAIRLYVAPRKANVRWLPYWRDHYRKSRPAQGLLCKTLNAAFDITTWALSRSAILRRAAVFMESRVFPGSLHAHVFRRHRPDVVVVTSLGNLAHGSYIMREARRSGAKVVSIVLSWDNPTTKGMAGAHADHVVAWTDTMKRELIDIQGIAGDDILVGGVPIYDTYARPDVLPSRDTLFGHFGLDPDRALIVLGLMSPTQFPWNPDLIRTLGKAIACNAFGVPCQAVVRLHPLYFRTGKDSLRYREEAEELLAIGSEWPHLRMDVPKTVTAQTGFDMSAGEMAKLGGILREASCLLCFFSSLMIEACIFDTPVVNLAMYPRNLIPTENLIEYDHLRRILDLGAARIAWTEEEMVELVSMYLRDPSVDREARRQVVERETGPSFGGAGKRIAEYLRRLVESDA